ncbi:MAG: hypothetical protein QXX17_02980 [Conexivisphaerales archaeon]
MSTVAQTQSVGSISEEIESLFKELKALPVELQERGRFVPISMEEDPDIINTYYLMKELNESLQRSQNDAVSAFAAANNLFSSYSALYESFKRALNSVRAALGIQTSRVVSRLQSITVRFETLVNRMVAMAVAMLKKYSKELSISSVSLTITSTPANISANFTYTKTR